jgi:hypothetical protein
MGKQVLDPKPLIGTEILMLKLFGKFCIILFIGWAAYVGEVGTLSLRVAPG